MAPNMVTLLGTLGNASMVLALVLMDTSFKKELHMLFYYLASFSIFFYQTMDAVDGKQARRTNAMMRHARNRRHTHTQNNIYKALPDFIVLTR